MSDEEKRYMKKPKAILVMDCAYLSGELRKRTEDWNSKDRELTRATQTISDQRVKIIKLQTAIQALSKTIELIGTGI